MSLSGVVSMAFANTGFVLLCTISSKMFPPGKNARIEVLEDYLAYLAPQSWRAILFEIFINIEIVRMQPILALCSSLHCMNVHRLITLVGIKIEPPPLHIQNSGHQRVISL
jgi:hypothetical protein